MAMNHDEVTTKLAAFDLADVPVEPAKKSSWLALPGAVLPNAPVGVKYLGDGGYDDDLHMYPTASYSTSSMWTVGTPVDDLTNSSWVDVARFWEKSLSAAKSEHLTALLADPLPPPSPALSSYADDLRFRYADDQPTLTGYHRKALLVDQHDRRWIFKPAPDSDHRFRPEVEHEAAVLARMWGFDTAQSHLITFDGVYGQAQRQHDVKSTLAGKRIFTNMSVQDITAIAREHLLDWAIDNDDSHGDNMVVTADGRIIGIDKGRAWRYFGGWQGLTGDHRANSNAQLVATALFTAIAAGQLPQTTVDQAYLAVIARAQQMQYLRDDLLIEVMNRALQNRPHYRPSSYQIPVDGAPTCREELIEQAVSRKNRLVADMRQLWSAVYERAGWTLPTPHPLGVNTQGHPMLSGLLDPRLEDALRTAQFHGVPVFVAGEHIEDAHVLIWRERQQQGFTIRGQFKIRASARRPVSAYCRTAVEPSIPAVLVPLARPASSLGYDPVFDDNGDLTISGCNLTEKNLGRGKMWQVALPTGETITLQLDKPHTQTRLSYQGNVMFAIPAGTDLTAGLTRIKDQLAAMGCKLTPATRDDLELYYWRHLAGIMADRVDTSSSLWAPFWEAVKKISKRTKTTTQLTAWRNAYRTHLGCPVDTVLAAGKHLPRFMHLNPRHQHAPCGRPYWERWDITFAHAMTKNMPATTYKSGGRRAADTGALYSTEARIRALGIFKSGQSSLDDMRHGSAAFLFLRQNQHLGTCHTIYINRRVLLRTHNYAFNQDEFGKIKQRKVLAYWNFDYTTGHHGTNNELMVKDALSILDDVEIITFNHPEERQAAIDAYHQAGITHIRGLPIEVRFIISKDRYAALEAVSKNRPPEYGN